MSGGANDTAVELRFVSEVPDIPAFRALLEDYYNTVGPGIHGAGGPVISARDMAQSTLDALDTLLPPDNRLLLGWTGEGRLVACGTLRRIRPDAVEMKRMFVRPEAQGLGLGRRLFEMRIAEARAMGCTAIYADTYRGNDRMLSLYDGFGFKRISRYPENANPPDFDPFLIYLEYRFDG